MKRKKLVGLFILSAGLALPAEEVSDGERLFALKVKPLFAEKCNACHGDEPEKLKGDFDMRTRESMLKGGGYFGGDVVVEGKGKESFLYLTTTRTEEDYEMPPKEADRLSEEQQWWVRDWINEGAPWPDDERVALIQDKYGEGIQVVTTGALSSDWQNRRYEREKLWAYHPLKVVEVPEGANPVDWFISQKLEKVGLEAAPDADAKELIRRISFNLTGLPPAQSRVEAFKEAYAKGPESAVKSLAKDLMATPQYGEHFARHLRSAP